MKKLMQGFSVLVVICMLITMMPKVNFADEEAVKSVTAKLEEIDTLEGMQNARESFKASGTYSATTAENHELMRAEYKQYLADMLTARADAAEAYAALSEEDKALIDPELVKKLHNNLDTVWKTVSDTVSAGVDAYQYQAVYPGYAYELSNHMVSKDGGQNNEIPQTAAFDLYFHGKKATYNIGTYPVDKKGVLVVENLLPGNYELVESVVPEGYLNPEKSIAFSIDEEGVMTLADSADAELVDGVVVVNNYPTTITPPSVTSLGSLSIKKVDSVSKETLEGATFTLKGKNFEKTTTDENGKGKFDNLPYGDYKVEETKAPEGYLLSKEATDTFTILKPDQKEKFTYENTRKNPSLAVEKTADKTQYLPRETVTYTIKVTNDGNVDLTGITLDDVFSKNDVVADQQLTVEGYEGAFDLAIGETVSFTSKFVIPKNDLADTTYKNVVTTKTGDTTDEAEVVIVVDPTYAFTIEKTADKTEAAVGETITYTIDVTNTGNKDLTNIVVKDEMIGLETVIDQLAANWSTTLTGEYVVTNDDIGELENIATATVEIDGEPITHEASVIVTVSAEVEAAVDETDVNGIQNPQTGDTTINTLLILFVFVIAGSGLYIYRRKLRG